MLISYLGLKNRKAGLTEINYYLEINKMMALLATKLTFKNSHEEMGSILGKQLKTNPLGFH